MQAPELSLIKADVIVIDPITKMKISSFWRNLHYTFQHICATSGAPNDDGFVKVTKRPCPCSYATINAITANAMKHQRGLLPLSLVCLENDKMKGKELHVIYGIVQAAIASPFEQPQVNVFSMALYARHTATINNFIITAHKNVPGLFT